MSDPRTIVDTYLGMWNETDPARRTALIEQAWASDARYVDPVLKAEGYRAISDMVAGVHARFPGHRFERVGGIDSHNGQLRFAWRLAAPDGTIAVAGLDVGELAADGRLRHITGFFGELPAEAAA